MSATKVSSAAITNARATPPTYNDNAAAGSGRARIIAGTMEVATTSMDDVGDVILMFDIRGDERLVKLEIFNDDMDSDATPTLAVDCGLYKDVTAAGTGATVVDADAYASAITTLQSANTAGVNIMCEARDIAAIGAQNVSTDGAALSGEDTQHANVRTVGLTVTTTAATAAAGTLSWVAVAVKV